MGMRAEYISYSIGKKQVFLFYTGIKETTWIPGPSRHKLGRLGATYSASITTIEGYLIGLVCVQKRRKYLPNMRVCSTDNS